MYYLLGFRLVEASNKYVFDLFGGKESGNESVAGAGQEGDNQPVNKSISWLKSAVSKKYHATEHFARSRVFYELMSEPLVQQVRSYLGPQFISMMN